MNENTRSVSKEISDLVKSAQGSVLRVGGRHPMPSSGVVWSDDGVVVTTGHLRERIGLELGMPDFTARAASLVGTDPATGVSVVRIEGEAASVLSAHSWADPGSLEVGHLVLALGRPGRSIRASLGILGALGGGWTTPGGAKLERYIQPDIALSPGFGGGPLLDMEGRFVGVNSAFLLRGCTITIPRETLSGIVETLLRHGRMRRGYLGVVAHPVRLPATLEGETGRDSGLVLLSVEDGSAADKAGLLVGDVLLTIGGEAVRTLEDLLFKLGATEPGDVASLGLLRGGKALELHATVGERE